MKLQMPPTKNHQIMVRLNGSLLSSLCVLSSHLCPLADLTSKEIIITASILSCATVVILVVIIMVVVLAVVYTRRRKTLSNVEERLPSGIQVSNGNGDTMALHDQQCTSENQRDGRARGKYSYRSSRPST